MKKIYMTMIALLCGMAAIAQESDGVYATDIKVEKADAETTANLSVCLKNSVDVAAISFRVQLPEGVTVATKKNGKVDMTLNNDRAEDWGTDGQIASDGNWMLSVYDKVPFYENDGEIVSVKLNISEEVAAVDGTYEIKLYEISVATPAGESLTVSGAMPTETTCKLTVGDGTGINGINAADSKAPIYNVAGQRVSKAQKGVFIQNGKKVAVK